jgi:hypothetical protein
MSVSGIFILLSMFAALIVGVPEVWFIVFETKITVLQSSLIVTGVPTLVWWPKLVIWLNKLLFGGSSGKSNTIVEQRLDKLVKLMARMAGVDPESL